MSFTKDVKNEILTVNNNNEISDKLELEAITRLCGEIGIIPRKIIISSKNNGLIRRYISLAKKYYKIETNIIVKVIDSFDSHNTYSVEILDGADTIIEDLNLFSNQSKYRSNLNQANMDAYLRAAFLSRGSVNSPKAKSLHLEISSTNEDEILYLQRLMISLDFNARISKRKAYLVLYIKAKEEITDFLYHIGCNKIMNEFQNILITKDISANMKREVNLTIANQMKTNEAALEQIKYINYIFQNVKRESLDPKLLEVMDIRLEYQEESLTDLIEIINEKNNSKITKSGLNHRFRRIKELALSIKNNNSGK